MLKQDKPMTLTLQQPLKRVERLGVGVHELHLRVRPTAMMTRILVHAAGREIGRASFHHSMAEVDGSARLILPFVVHTPGLVQVKVSICQSFHGTMQGHSLEIESLQVVERTDAAQPSEADILPGQSNLDLWGWTSLAWEGHGHRFRVGEDYIRQRGVIEPWKWGCNFIQTHAYAYLPWHLEMVKFLHEHDFLVDEHGFPPQRRVEKVNGRVAVFRVHVQGSRLLPKSQEHLWPRRYVLENTLAFVEKWGRGFSNALREGWRSCIDGWEVEEYADPEDGVLASPGNVVKLHQRLWKYNPGVCLGSCNHTAAYKPEHYVWLHEGYHGPNFAHVAMDAGSSWKVSLPGYDDHVPMGEFADARSFQNPYNDIFLGYQADSRTYSYNDIGNLTWPDWLIKQSHDYCRLRNLGDAAAPPSALFWLNEGARLLPEAIREYAYIACQDVPRVAVAMNLNSTGLDGCFHWLADAFEDYLPQQAGQDAQPLPSSLTLRSREWDTANTTILQNNHLRLERDAHRPGGRLRFDPQGIAHFDLDSLSIALCDNLLQPESKRAHHLLEDVEVKITHARPWEHTLKLDAGEYEFNLKLPEEDQEVFVLHVNGRPAGVVTATRSRVSFSLPESTRCTLRLQPWRHAGQDVSAADHMTTAAVISLRQLDQFNQPAIHEINSIDACINEMAHVVEGDLPALPGLLGKGGAQLVDMPVELQAGQYLVCITANAAGREQNAQLRVGLNRHRHFTKHFAKLEMHKDVAHAIGSRHVPAAYSRVGRFPLTADARSHVIPLTVYEPGKHVIELFNPGPDAALHAVRIYRTPVEHHLLVKGGACAEVLETHKAEDHPLQVRYTLHNDLPVLKIEISPAGVERNILLLDTPRYRHAQTHDHGMTLRSEDGLTPAMHVMRTSGPVRLQNDGGKLKATIAAGKAAKIHLAVDAGCLRNMPVATIAAGLGKPSETIECAGEHEPVRVKHRGRLPVQVVKIANPQPGPYFVQEKGWWRLRGAQPITLAEEDEGYLQAYRQWMERNEKLGDTREALAPFAYRRHTADLPPARPTHGDYLKVYTSGEDAWVLPHGFIHGVARPGFGCQYTLALADVEGDTHQASLRVKVTRLTAYVFAPRVRFARPISAAWVDGKPWHYIDEDLLMLPQARGEYALRVEYGYPRTLSIARTAASITRTQVADRVLHFEAGLPEYVRKLHDDLDYHAHIALPAEGKLTCQGDATIVRQDKRGAIIRFKPGPVSVSW